MIRAFVFPGQGSQQVGMGRELAEAFPSAREVFEEVDDALSQKLFKLMAEGPESDLVLTENAQPALMAMSLAVVRVLAVEGKVTVGEGAAFVAGHSLGEYSALAAAGALAVADTARLLKRRGLAMQRAVPVGEGAMAALLGLSVADAEAVAAAATAEGGVCDVANDNCEGQVVVSGDKDAVGRAVELAKEKGGRRSILLPVSAPFHCARMRPAADEMAEALEKTAILPPRPALIANVTAAPVDDPVEIRRLLVAQVTARVRWRESVLAMKERGVEELVELGAGKVLAGMVRRIDREMSGRSVGAPADVEAFLESL